MPRFVPSPCFLFRRSSSYNIGRVVAALSADARVAADVVAVVAVAPA